MSSLLNKHDFAVAARGTLVVLSIDDASFSIEFHVALMISAAMRHAARIAKLNSGRDERGLHCLGVLHDASAPKPKRKRFIERLPELLNVRGFDVRPEGQLVALTIERTTVRLTYAGARTLAQWIRVRGKEAKRNAGEAAHWSEISRVDHVEAGERPWL